MSSTFLIPPEILITKSVSYTFPALQHIVLHWPRCRGFAWQYVERMGHTIVIACYLDKNYMFIYRTLNKICSEFINYYFYFDISTYNFPKYEPLIYPKIAFKVGKVVQIGITIRFLNSYEKLMICIHIMHHTVHEIGWIVLVWCLWKSIKCWEHKNLLDKNKKNY